MRVKSNSLLAVLVGLTLNLGFPGAAYAAVKDATAYSRISPYLSNLTDTSTQNTFGTNSYSAVSEAVITVEGNASGSPFIQFQASTPQTSASDINTAANLQYFWEVAGVNNALVLVHISTSGWIKSDYSYVPYQLNTYNLTPNTPNIGISANFVTATNALSGFDNRNYGLVTGGNFNWGVPRVQPIGNFTQRNGGSSHLYSEFSETFDLWVRPNVENTISLQAQSFLYQDSSFTRTYAKEAFEFSGFIDPVITIDAAWAVEHPGYSISVSPGVGNTVPVPEAETYAMMLAGLGLVGFMAKRRKQIAA
jgi:hypothetical protein